MGRRNPGRDEHVGLDVERARGTAPRVLSAPDGEWSVQHLSGGSTSTYRCPGCQQEIPPDVPHTVAWPADERGDVSDRRHWHTGCWRARDRRPPGGWFQGRR